MGGCENPSSALAPSYTHFFFWYLLDSPPLMVGFVSDYPGLWIVGFHRIDRGCNFCLIKQFLGRNWELGGDSSIECCCCTHEAWGARVLVFWEQEAALKGAQKPPLVAFMLQLLFLASTTLLLLQRGTKSRKQHSNRSAIIWGEEERQQKISDLKQTELACLLTDFV